MINFLSVLQLLQRQFCLVRFNAFCWRRYNGNLRFPCIGFVLQDFSIWQWREGE